MTKQFEIRKATRKQTRARIALIGPPGSGKTYSALRLAAGFYKYHLETHGKSLKILMLDTEGRRGEKYAGSIKFRSEKKTYVLEYDTIQLDEFSPDTYREAIEFAEDEGYDLILIDSLSHAWMGKGGALEMADTATAKYGGNTRYAWRDVRPAESKMLDKILRSTAEVIVTMRSKIVYVEESGKGGKKNYRQAGTAPIQKEGIHYEFDLVGDMDLEHRLIVTKCIMNELDLDGQVVSCPDEELGFEVAKWYDSGVSTESELVATKKELRPGEIPYESGTWKAEPPSEDSIKSLDQVHSWLKTSLSDAPEIVEIKFDQLFESNGLSGFDSVFEAIESVKKSKDKAIRNAIWKLFLKWSKEHAELVRSHS